MVTALGALKLLQIRQKNVADKHAFLLTGAPTAKYPHPYQWVDIYAKGSTALNDILKDIPSANGLTAEQAQQALIQVADKAEIIRKETSAEVGIFKRVPFGYLNRHNIALDTLELLQQVKK